MLDKQQLEMMYKHNLKVKRVLFIISMALFGLATGCLVAFIVLYGKSYDVLIMPDLLNQELYLSILFLDFFDTTISAGLVLLLFSLLIFNRRARIAKNMLDNFDQIYAEQTRGWNTKPSGSPIVDVKPMEEKPKGKYDDLIHEYEKLYEQGLISKEDLDNKKKELLS